MANTEKDALKTLHDLIATCNDAAEGYGKAAKGVHDPAISEKLAQISGERQRFAADLEAAVAKLGGEMRMDLHEGGILHSGWVDLEKHYDTALGRDLGAEIHSALDAQKAAVMKNIEWLRSAAARPKAQHA